MAEMEEVELIVVGAGIFGLTSAVTYHRIHPEARILILEGSSSIGGPWAPERTFPGLRTNNLWGTYQNPDYPMDQKRFGIKQGEHLPAEKVHQYLTAFVGDNGLKDNIRCNTKVNVVEKVGKGWKVHCTSTAKGREEQVTIGTAKLILAAGLANQPAVPKYPTSPNFTPTIVHSSGFAERYHDIVGPNNHTLVVGTGKSAWDIAYACSTQPDATVTMLMRPSGNGPVWMSPSHVTPFGLWLEKLVFTRFFGFMSPCPWAVTTGFEGWIRYLLHSTWLGQRIVNGFWWVLGDDVVKLNKLNEHPETQKLRPWRDAFESGNALSIHNYPTSFFDLVKEGKIKIVVDDVEKFGEGKEVLLSGGEKIQVDAVACATGWDVGGSLKVKPEGLEKKLGMPTKNIPDEDDRDLIKKVEDDLYARFPYLKWRDSSRLHHPDPSQRYAQTSHTTQQPYRLYRFLVPSCDFSDRSIGFSGALSCLGTAFCAYIQAIWLTAYLDGTLALPSDSPEKIRYETYLNSQYCILRNAWGWGNQAPDLVFDSLPYFDELMSDLGFDGKRKEKFLGVRNWGREAARSYGPEDYAGLLDEWKEKVARGSVERKKNV